MDFIGYSSCAIRFAPNDNAAAPQRYSDRSLIELRQDIYRSYFLRAIDLDKDKKVCKLFNNYND
jgi:hypothetical protein